MTRKTVVASSAAGGGGGVASGRRRPRRTRETTRPPRAVDHVDSSSDEEIDEDGAFDSDDERRYGALFGPSKKVDGKKTTTTTRRSDDDDDDDDSASGSDDDDDGGSSSDDDDGVAGEDEEEEEGDGGAYMLSLLDKIAPTPAAAAATSSSSSSKGASDGRAALARHSRSLPESEHDASVVTKTNLTLDELLDGMGNSKGFAKTQKLMAEVSGARRVDLDDGGGGSASTLLKTAEAPLPKVVSDRLSRKVHYQSSKDDATQWIDAVKRNRQAETLDFRVPKSEIVKSSKEDLVGKFVPTTDFEKEIADALERKGLDDERAAARERAAEEGDGEGEEEEEDDLGRVRLTAEEYKARRGELAKMRALLFYEERKRHRLNKIKSKKYRKIRKKQRERRSNDDTEARLLGGDEELEKELREKEELERMKERMSLAHKNTSKWAKRVLRRGGKVDVDTRRALSAQLQAGEDLRKRMHGVSYNADDGSDIEDGKDLVDVARDVLRDAEKSDEEGGAVDGKKKGLLQLSFMKRGMEAQRNRAKEEARRLLRELEADDAAAASSSSDEDDARNEEGRSSKRKKKKKKPRVASEAETAEVLPQGKLVASRLEFGSSDAIAVSGGIDVDLSLGDDGGGGDRAKTDATEKGTTAKGRGFERHEATARLSDVRSETVADASKRPSSERRRIGDGSKDNADAVVVVEGIKERRKEKGEEEESNPWMVVKADPSSGGRKKRKKLRKDDGDDDGGNAIEPTMSAKQSARTPADRRPRGVKRDGVVDVGGAASVLLDDDDDGSTNERPKGDSKERDDGEDGGGGDKKISSMTQEELVRRAFAAPSEAEAEEEFEKEKEAARERDDGSSLRKSSKKGSSEVVVSGWGSWAGAGAPPPRPPKRRPSRNPKLRPPDSKVDLPNKRKRKDDDKNNVIINERRIKRTANNFQIPNVPYPYASREQYEKSMSGGIGTEWNVSSAVKSMTRPEVVTRAGKIVRPLSVKAKGGKKGKKMFESRGPAKF